MTTREHAAMNGLMIYVHDTVVQPEIENIQASVHSLSSEFQETKSYVTQLEQRINKLETLFREQQDKSIDMKNQLDAILAKKKPFWKKHQDN